MAGMNHSRSGRRRCRSSRNRGGNGSRSVFVLQLGYPLFQAVDPLEQGFNQVAGRRVCLLCASGPRMRHDNADQYQFAPHNPPSASKTIPKNVGIGKRAVLQPAAQHGSYSICALVHSPAANLYDARTGDRLVLGMAKFEVHSPADECQPHHRTAPCGTVIRPDRLGTELRMPGDQNLLRPRHKIR